MFLFLLLLPCGPKSPSESLRTKRKNQKRSAKKWTVHETKTKALGWGAKGNQIKQK